MKESNGRSMLKLDLDYRRPPANGDSKILSNAELTSDYIHYAVMDTHAQGIEGQQRRVFARIQRKLDEAIENKTSEIELEEAEKDLLRKSFRDCKVPAQIAKLFVVLEDEVDRVCAR